MADEEHWDPGDETVEEPWPFPGVWQMDGPCAEALEREWIRRISQMLEEASEQDLDRLAESAFRYARALDPQLAYVLTRTRGWQRLQKVSISLARKCEDLLRDQKCI
jgi:hypothetical protein